MRNFTNGAFGFAYGVKNAFGLSSQYSDDITNWHRAAVWLLSPMHALQDAFRSGFHGFEYMTIQVNNSGSKRPTLPGNDKASLRFGIYGTALVSLIQGPVVYAAVYGIGYGLGCAGLDMTAMLAAHGVASCVAGWWLGSGRGLSGILSGIAVGATTFALQTCVLPELVAAMNGVDMLHLHLLCGAITIVATLGIEAIAQMATRVGWESLDKAYQQIPEFTVEHYMLHLLIDRPCLQASTNI